MIVDTKAYGQVEVDERQKIRFPDGLYGFENLQDFVLLDARQRPFFWLQSQDVSEIAFVLMDPSLIRSDYDANIDQIDYEELDLKGAEDEKAIQFAIITIPKNREEMTANLQGPIIINKESRIGRQCISRNENYQVRHNVLDEMSSAGKKSC